MNFRHLQKKTVHDLAVSILVNEFYTPTLRVKVPKYGVTSGSYFPNVGLNMEIYAVNIAEIFPYLTLFMHCYLEFPDD